MADYPLEVDCQTVSKKLSAGESFLLLDCREPSEHQTVNISAAKLLPMSQLEGRVGELADHKAGEIIVHCHHGGRSLRVAKWLRAQGFAQVASMAGGIDQWAVEIDPKLPRY
jgi:rhodanese-related sulfurtransferase